MSTALILTGMITSFVWILAGLLFFIINATEKKRNNIDVLLRYYTKGQPMIDYQRARLTEHPQYGQVIYMPKIKKAYTRIDQEFYLPQVRNGRFFLDVTMKDNYMYINKTSKKLEFKELEKDFSPNIYRITGEIVNPIPYVDRMQGILAEKMLKKMTEQSKGLLQSPVVVMGITLIIALAIIVIVTVLTQNYAQDLVQTTLQQTGSDTVIQEVANQIQQPR